MYVKKVHIAESPVNGMGVFAGEPIEKDETVWQFSTGYDHAITAREFEALPEEYKQEIHHSGYLSPWTDLWIYPPKDDAACYTNHSKDNNLSVKYDAAVSKEPYFVANRAISAGEELTNNYHEFDQITRHTNPEWAR